MAIEQGGGASGTKPPQNRDPLVDIILRELKAWAGERLSANDAATVQAIIDANPKTLADVYEAAEAYALRSGVLQEVEQRARQEQKTAQSVTSPLAEGNQGAAAKSPGAGGGKKKPPAGPTPTTGAGAGPTPVPVGAGGGAAATVPAGGGEADTARQVPGGGELWKVGRTVYLAYKIPGTNTPLIWKIENPERLEAITGSLKPDIDRVLTEAEFKRLSPVVGGLSAELQVTDEDPWQVFMSKFNEQAELRPWLRDPTVMAVIGVAYLEGRQPTTDELSQTDWWNNHTEDERAWMESTVTAGSKEVQRRKNDAVRAVEEALRQAGMAAPPRHVAEYIATQRLTGKWSETYTAEQVRKITDPFAAGTLDRGLLAVLRDPAAVSPGDARAIADGRDAVRERIRAIFENRRVSIGTDTETEDARLDRITREVLSGKRTIDDVRNSVDQIAIKEGGRPGGLDVTRQGEDRVKDLATQWLGPVMGKLPDQKVAEWAGRIRNDPDAEQEFIEHLQGQRMAMFPGYTNPDLTYEDIVSPFRNLATSIWRQPMEDDGFLVDLANTQDYNEAAKRLRREGRGRGIEAVLNDSYKGLIATGLGEAVQRSSI